MKRIFIFGAIASLLASCSNKLEGEGAIATQLFEYEEYESINAISIDDEFTLCFSNSVADGIIEISTYENVLGYVDIDISGTKLSLSVDSKKIKGDLQLLARMKTPVAPEIEVVETDPDLDLDADPDADADTETELEPETEPNYEDYVFDYVFEARGGSTIYFENKGSLRDCSIVLSGASSFWGYNLTSSETVWVDVSGNSTLQITAEGTFCGSCASGSYISYKGSALTSVTTSNDSTLVKSDSE